MYGKDPIVSLVIIAKPVKASPRLLAFSKVSDIPSSYLNILLSISFDFSKAASAISTAKLAKLKLPSPPVLRSTKFISSSNIV